MPKLINLTHPYEIENVKNLKEFLFILKNIIRVAERFGITEKKDGILIPVRWSKKYNQCVVDRGTDLFRDRDGITKENVDLYFYKENQKLLNKAIKYVLSELNNDKFVEIVSKYNVIKNENKFLCFEYCNGITNVIDNAKECLYPIGLFQRCESKKRSGIYNKIHKSLFVDNSLEFCNDISKISNSISVKNKISFKNHLEVYNNFLKLIQDSTLDVTIDNVITSFLWKDILIENIKKSTKGSYKDAIHFYKLKDNISTKDYNNLKFYYLTYSLYVEFVNYLKSHFNLLDSEGFVVTDLNNHIYYKLSFLNKGKNNIEKHDDKKLFAPLPLGVF